MSSPNLVTALFPDYLWYEDKFVPDFAILLSETGILEIDASSNIEQTIEKRREKGEYITRRTLKHRALLPGFVNTHSHAFQRAIRGRTEFPTRRSGTSENFWSWREVMYQTALHLEPEDVEAIAQAVYVEMVKSGITHVGEFHYLHHKPDGSLYDDPDELTHRVLSGARSAGMNLTLLRSFYQRAGVGRPEPEGAQKIFSDPDVDFYLSSLDRLQEAGIAVGVTPHSVRAVARKDLEKLIAYSQDKELPFHIHVSEQPKEIAECLEEHKLRPVEFLQELGALSPRTTLVHAIHLNEAEIRSIGQNNVSIASCPTTERNLGDGIVSAKALRESGAFFTFGTDSQCQIFLPEDARQLEYHLRLRELSRSILAPDASSAGAAFLNMLTANGARSLGETKGGELRPGYASNLVAIDLEHLSLAGFDAQSLALDIVFSSTPDAVTDVWCKGAEIVTGGHHRAEKQALRNLQRVLQKLRRL